MPKVGIVYNDAKPIAVSVAMDMKLWLEKRNIQAVLATGNGGILGYGKPDAPVCHTPIESLVPLGFDRDIMFVVALGGDGTVLSTCRQIAPLGLPVLNVNTGHMGFLTEIYLTEWEEAIAQVVEGQYVVEQRSMMAVRVYDSQGLLWEALSLNEMVLHREPLTSMCHFEVQIGQHMPVDIAADGVIISTPTGRPVAVADALGMLYGAVKFRSKDPIINRIFMEMALLVAPMGCHAGGHPCLVGGERDHRYFKQDGHQR